MRTDIHNPSLAILPYIFALLFILAAPVTQFGQDLPDKIQGYKVHKTIISVENSELDITNSRGEAVVRVGEPQLADVSINGVTLSASAAITALSQSGKVDFLTFHDFRVNGIPVDIEQYDESFSFKKNEPVNLPRPAKMFIPTARILKAAWKEVHNSKESWTVTGRVFAFGRFRKMGFSFKRVIPIDVKLTVKNPLPR